MYNQYLCYQLSRDKYNQLLQEGQKERLLQEKKTENNNKPEIRTIKRLRLILERMGVL